jgi:hypothetical protein
MNTDVSKPNPSDLCPSVFICGFMFIPSFRGGLKPRLQTGAAIRCGTLISFWVGFGWTGFDRPGFQFRVAVSKLFSNFAFLIFNLTSSPADFLTHGAFDSTFPRRRK